MDKNFKKYNNKEAKARKMSKQRKFKKGAASFYIVAMATLILGIVAASFATVVISQVTRSANDDLKQSADQAARQGLNDGVIAYGNYQECKNAEANAKADSDSGNDDSWKDLKMGGTPALTCNDLVRYVEDGTVPATKHDYDVVPDAAGAEKEPDANGEYVGVKVQGPSDDSGLEQYYTYVSVESQTEDALGVVNDDQATRAFRLKFRGDNLTSVGGILDEGGTTSPTGVVKNNANSKDIKTIRVSWHSATEDSDSKNGLAFTWMNTGFGGIFGQTMAVPAVLQLSVVQSSETFDLTQFDQSKGNQTNRGTITMVPTYETDAGVNAGESYIAAYDGTKNAIPSITADGSKSGLLKSNDKSYKNLPFLVYCDYKLDYACSVDVELPEPVGGDRSDQTFVVAVTLPYAKPQTHFKLEFLDGSGNPAVLDGVQVKIDATGRANDVYSRLEGRYEAAQSAYPYPLMALEVLGGTGDPSIKKNFYSACEYDLTDVTSTDGHGCLNNPTH